MQYVNQFIFMSCKNVCTKVTDIFKIPIEIIFRYMLLANWHVWAFYTALLAPLLFQICNGVEVSQNVDLGYLSAACLTNPSSCGSGGKPIVFGFKN